MKTYISGQITGLDLEIAKKKFNNADLYLTLACKHETVNPFDLFTTDEEKSFTWKQFMLRDLEALFECEAIYMLNNWKESRGARLEHAAAIESDMIIHYQPINGGQ